MMSAEYMDSLKRDAERKSRREGVTPAILLPAHKEGKLKPSIPFVGERTWKRDWVEADLDKMGLDQYGRGDVKGTNIIFVDSSGWGNPGETALTVDQFIAMVPAGFGYAVVEAGQFQVCVRAFIPPVGCRITGVNYDVAKEAETV
jgi:hypothetical protein